MAGRVSSASTDSEYVPAMVPFAWEVVPGRAAVPEITTEAPPLPLPPGRRPKDGFYLPIPRPAQLEAQERRPFHLKLPGPSLPRKLHGSRATRRALVAFQRRGSLCLGAACTLLHHGRKAPDHDHTGRRLEKFSEEEEDCRDPHPTPRHSESPPSSCSSNLSQPGTGKQLQAQSQVLGSTRFMASMLMVLCPDEVDAENESSDDEDSFTFPAQPTMSSPDPIFPAPQQEIQLADRAPAHEERTRAWVDQEQTIAHLQYCEVCGRRKPLLDTNLDSDASFSFPVHMADAHPLSSSEGSPDREEGPLSFSWKPRHGPRSSSCAGSSANSVPASQKMRPTVWFQEALQSSPRWPHPGCDITGHSDGESGSDVDVSSVELSENYRVGFGPPGRVATWEVSEKLLKSSALLQCKQRRQQSHESPRSSFVVDQEESGTLVTSADPNKGADDLLPSSSCRVSETSESNDGVMSKVAHWEAKVGVGSSGKSLPIYLSRRSGTAVTGKPSSR